MRQRCNDPNIAQWLNYGGRGITVCSRWDRFDHFVEDMYPTYRDGLTLDRIDNNGDYSPSNCRWATRAEQANNKRGNHNITHDGRTMNMTQWAKELGMPRTRLKTRLKLGWSVERALST
jgi:hypothetical protein